MTGLSDQEGKQRASFRKLVVYSITINIVQMVAVLLLTLLILTDLVDLHHSMLLNLVVCVAALAVCWGAVVDIREALNSAKVQRQATSLEEAYGRLETLNIDMRAQRHDFMNHLQVVYSLLEMEEYDEALSYIDRVHGDMQRVSRMLRTASPAVNALLQAKVVDAEGRGIRADILIRSQWEKLPMPGWEMCRVLGNLIDNAMDALTGVEEPVLRITLYEDLKHYGFRVENNGPPITAHEQARIFSPGFTTKVTGQGMGLFIVSRLIKKYGGDISVTSTPAITAFEGNVLFEVEPVQELDPAGPAAPAQQKAGLPAEQ